MFSLVIARVDVGHIIGIIFLVISVLSWFVNFIQGNTPDGTPRPQKAKPKAAKGQSEIETLLQELSGPKQKPKPERIEPPPRPPKPPVERGRPKPQATKQRMGAQPATTATRSAARITESQLPSANLGAAVRSLHLANRVEASVENGLAAGVQQDLGDRVATATSPEKPLHPLVKVLRDPDGIRSAIVLNEILQRPKALRR